MNTTWKPVLGYEGFYEVSNTGLVRSVDREIWNGRTGKGSHKKLRGKILKPAWSKDQPYPAVGLHKIGPTKTFPVHKLVAKHFVPNPIGLREVNHKDGNKLNNNDWNLEWSTRQHNCQHAIDTGLNDIRGELNYFAKLNASKVRLIRHLRLKGLTQAELGAMFGVTGSNISCILRRTSWGHLPDQACAQ